MATGIFPGRFDPLHKGHLMVIQGMVKACRSVVIVICSPKGEDGKPMYSVDKRREMLTAALLDVDILDVTIATVSDDPSDELWAKYVLDAAENPSDAQVWSGDESVRALFEKANVLTKKIVPVPGHVSSEIQEMIKKNDRTWEKKVPNAVADVILGR